MSRPNLPFIMPGQMRHDLLSACGAPHLTTSPIDHIGAEGIRYERVYSLHPVSVPAKLRG